MRPSESSLATKVSTAIVGGGLLLGLTLLGVGLLQWSEWSPFVASKYVGLGGVLTVGMGLCLALGGSWRASGAVTLITAAMALFAADVFVGKGYHRPPAPKGTTRAEVARSLGIAWDDRSKLEVIDALRAEGRDTWPTVHPLEFHNLPLQVEGHPVHPLAGIPDVATVYCNEGGQYTVYDSDAHGFNNPKDQHTLGADLALVGDSFAHGACVPAGHDLGSQLRALSGLRVLNLGYGGNGPLMSLAALSEYAAPLKPKHVVWVHYPANDLSDLEDEARSVILRRYLTQDGLQNLKRDTPALDQALRAYAQKAEAKARKAPKPQPTEGVEVNKSRPLRLKDVLSLYHLRKQFYLRPTANPQGLFRQVLKEARDRVRAWGGELHFVYLPVVPHYPLDARWRRDEILEIVRELDIDLLDFQQTVEALPDPLVCYNLRITGHFSSEGYRRLAESIVQAWLPTSTSTPTPAATQTSTQSGPQD